ncbi:reverse transcriptase domain-containing protein [Tanacetum coccineum]
MLFSSASSRYYTSVYIESEPGRVFRGADEEISNGGSLQVIVLGYDGLPIQSVAPPSPDYIPGPEEPHTPPVPQDEDERAPMLIQPHDPDYVPEPIYPEYIPLEDEHEFLDDPEEYEDDETEDGLVDYPMDGGDDGDDDDDDSFGDDANDKDEDEGGDEDEEEEEHPAPADSAVVYLLITVRLQASISLPPEAKVERLLAMTTPSPSPPISLSPPSAGERLARCTAPPAHSSSPPVPSPLPPSSGCPTQIQTLRIAYTQALIDAVTIALPSPPLPPLPPSLYIPLPIDRRDDLPESELPPRKRLCLSTLGSRYEVGKSSTTRPIGGRGTNYGFVSTVDAEARQQGISEVGYGIRDTWVDPAEAVPEVAPMTVGEVNTKFTELAELNERDTQDLRQYGWYRRRLMLPKAWAHSIGLSTSDITTTEGYSHSDTVSDMRREMSDMHAELLAHREQQKRAKQPGPDARIPDHQDAYGDADSHIYTCVKPTKGDEATSNGDNQTFVQTTRPCFYADFMKCQPLNFKGTRGVVGLTRWIEKMESVFNISGCAIENQVKFATCTLLGAALTWWNGQIRTLGPDAYSMTWEVLKKKIQIILSAGEIKKRRNQDCEPKGQKEHVPTYTERFQELTLICTKFVANETEKVDKYISGLPDNIYGNVKSSRPKTLDETIELANDLMDQKLRTYAERQTDNKRKANDSSRNNHGHQQQPFKRQNVAKVGHFARDCRSSGNTYVANAQKDNRAVPKGNGYFECRALGHFKRDCPKLKGEMGMHKAGYMQLEMQRRIGMHPGTRIPMSSRIDIALTQLENSYDVELADGKIVGIHTIIRGCTLDFLNHPFNIDLMPVELGSFEVIIGMDWLRRYHAVIVCDEKLVRIPYGNETLIFHGNESNNCRESRLTIISYSKAQEYMAKGCQIFLAQISAKKEKDKSEGKKLKDVPIV